MNSYEKRIADSVARIAKEKSGNYFDFIKAMVDLVVLETRHSYARGIRAGCGKARTFGQWRPGELMSALKAGKLKAVKRD